MSPTAPEAAHRGEIIAYFSMEIGLESSIPTYAGGLGVLAGDTVRAAADLAVPMVAVSLVHRQGYFRQHLDGEGNQTESPAHWQPEERLEPMTPRVTVNLEGRSCVVRAWRYMVEGISGYRTPVYLLDTALPENSPEHQRLTDHLYGGDLRYRLGQEAVLGLGGSLMLGALGYRHVRAYHLNEGHSALLCLGLLEELAPEAVVVPAVRAHCVFTTHTPVPAGHDQFPMDLVQEVLGPKLARRASDLGCCLDNKLNMTYLALYFSRFVNGVAMRHGQISRGMFPGYPVASITNGVHAATWVTLPFQEVFNRHIPEWRRLNANLRYAVGIPLSDIQEAHRRAKGRLIEEVERRTGLKLAPEVMTLGFARRATPYKRADMLLADLERLRRIARRSPLQIIYAGKAHPDDASGKEIIRRIFERANALRPDVPLVYLQEYDMALARDLCAGADLWINTPQQPQEASGTSGMKAALNGVPSLSVLDGWWIEGHVEGVTGWSVGESWEPDSAGSERDIAALYTKLEQVADFFYQSPEDYARVMQNVIALNASFFHAQRMLQQYAVGAYRLTHASP